MNKERIEELEDALRWLLTNAERITRQEPVRNWDEILLHAHTVLGESETAR